MFGDVIVPIDGSADSAHALDVAAVIAKANHSQLHVLAYTTNAHDPALFLPGIENVAATAARLGVQPRLSVEPLTTTVAQQVLDEVQARPGSLVCLSSHGRTRTAAYFGSVTTELLQRYTGPVLVCGPRYKPGNFHLTMSGPIIVALDGSPESETILPIAEAWSMVFGLSLEVVTVLPVEPRTEAKAGLATGDLVESTYVKQIAKRAGSVTTRTAGFEVLHSDKPSQAIVDEAILRNATVIAMATHAPSGHHRFSQPSVTSEVIKRSPIPVLAARPLHPSV